MALKRENLKTMKIHRLLWKKVNKNKREITRTSNYKKTRMGKRLLLIALVVLTGCKGNSQEEKKETEKERKQSLLSQKRLERQEIVADREKKEAVLGKVLLRKSIPAINVISEYLAAFFCGGRKIAQAWHKVEHFCKRSDIEVSCQYYNNN